METLGDAATAAMRIFTGPDVQKQQHMKVGSRGLHRAREDGTGQRGKLHEDSSTDQQMAVPVALAPCRRCMAKRQVAADEDSSADQQKAEALAPHRNKARAVKTLCMPGFVDHRPLVHNQQLKSIVCTITDCLKAHCTFIVYLHCTIMVQGAALYFYCVFELNLMKQL